MTKNKQSWLARLDEADQKAQRRLEFEDNNDTEVVFKKTKSRSHRQTTKEQMRISTIRISGLFIAQIFLLGWLMYATSGALEFSDALGTAIALSAILSILTIAMIAMYIYSIEVAKILLFIFCAII